MTAENFDPTLAIEDQASDSLVRTIALYKAAGWSSEDLCRVVAALWGLTCKAQSGVVDY